MLTEYIKKSFILTKMIIICFSHTFLISIKIHTFSQNSICVHMQSNKTRDILCNSLLIFSFQFLHGSFSRNQAEVSHTCRGTISLHGALIHTVDSCTFVISNGGTQTFHIKGNFMAFLACSTRYEFKNFSFIAQRVMK